jgi:hypothetical protein
MFGFQFADAEATEFRPCPGWLKFFRVDAAPSAP